jgi:uncharacterized protein
MAKREKPSALRSFGRKTEDILFRGGWARNLAYAVSLQKDPEIKRIQADIGLQSKGMTRLTIAFVSDLHSGRMTHPDIIGKTGDLLREEKFDLLLLGGDYVFLSADEIGLVKNIFEKLAPRLGKYGVLGNHDRWVNNDLLLEKLDEAGVKILVNEEISFPAPFDFISVFGLDDFEWGNPSFDKLAENGKELKILLAHSPEALSILGDKKFDLALFGHTHAGQIKAPCVPPLLPFKDSFSKRFPYGYYEKGEKNEFLPMYVTSGIGCVWLPVRLFAKPEVVMITLY